MNRIMITGAAGFIGAALSLELVQRGYQVYGIDNLNDYYDVQLKKDRLSRLKGINNFQFEKLDIAEKESLFSSFKKFKPEIVSSSVYGKKKKIPFSEGDNVDRPVSYYAATKKSNELMAAAYSELYKLRTTGLRFFTVYGPWGRPDMAPWLFTQAILNGKSIKVFNYGKMQRDFTYIDDIVTGVIGLIEVKHSQRELFNIYNIGNNEPEELGYFIEILEKECGIKATKEYLPMQMGDVPVTYADISRLYKLTGFKPQTSLEEGLKKFVAWFKNYRQIN